MMNDNERLARAIFGDAKVDSMLNEKRESQVMIINCKMKYWNDPARVLFSRYENGRTAIRLVAPDDGEPLAVATVNLPNAAIAQDEAAIKDYSENEGMARVLADAGLIEPEADRWLRSGFVTVGVYRLTSKAIGERARQERYAEQR